MAEISTLVTRTRVPGSPSRMAPTGDAVINRTGRGSRIQGSIPAGLASQLPRAAQQVAAQVETTLGDISTILQNKELAKNKSEFNSSVAMASEELDAVQFEVMQDTTINPLDRRDEYNKRVQGIAKAHGKNLPRELQDQLATELRVQATSNANRIDAHSTQEFLQNQSDSLDAQVKLNALKYHQAETDLDRSIALGRMNNSLQDMVDLGIVTEEEGHLRMAEFEASVESQALNRFLRDEPDLLLEHITSLDEGGSGVEGMPHIPESQRQGLFNKAQEEFIQNENFARASEEQAEKLKAESQEQLMAEIFDRAYNSNGSPAELGPLKNEISVAREQGLISPDDSTRGLATITKMINAYNQDTLNQNDPALQREIILLLKSDPDRASRIATDRIGNGVSASFANQIRKDVRSMKHQDHFENLSEYKAANRLIKSSFSVDPFEAALGDTGTQREIAALATFQLYERVRAIAGPDGLNKQQVLQQLPEIRDNIIKTVKENIKNEFLGKPIESGDPTHAVEIARNRLELGGNRDDVEARLLEELQHHYFRQEDVDPTDLAGFEEWMVDFLTRKGFGE
jgi:hypothetical protein